VSITGINIVDLINLAGALLNFIVAFVFPVLFYIAFNERKGRLGGGEKNFLIAILCIGAVLVVAAVVEGVMSIYSGRYD